MTVLQQIRVNGAAGEGGGQILRTSLALSMVTGRPFRIENIRAGRQRPGLLRQHLTSVQAAQAVCSGEVSGAVLGSSELQFAPSKIRGGAYEFSISTAGSTTLVLQTILPALMTASEPSEVVISGGTHNSHAPSVEFLNGAFLPLIRKMGPSVQVELEQPGFYPAGGGRIRVHIEPADSLKPVTILEATPVRSHRAIATIAGLPPSIAKRELAVLSRQLGWDRTCFQIRQLKDNVGPGNILSVEIVRDELTEVFTGFGEQGVAAESVAHNTAQAVRQYLAADVPVWRHLADQLMLPMALSGHGCFQTTSLSPHAVTNASVIERFLPVQVHCIEHAPKRVTVSILA